MRGDVNRIRVLISHRSLARTMRRRDHAGGVTVVDHRSRILEELRRSSRPPRRRPAIATYRRSTTATGQPDLPSTRAGRRDPPTPRRIWASRSDRSSSVVRVYGSEPWGETALVGSAAPADRSRCGLGGRSARDRRPTTLRRGRFLLRPLAGGWPSRRSSRRECCPEGLSLPDLRYRGERYTRWARRATMC